MYFYAPLVILCLPRPINFEQKSDIPYTIPQNYASEKIGKMSLSVVNTIMLHKILHSKNSNENQQKSARKNNTKQADHDPVSLP